MEVTTQSNLSSLALVISDRSYDSPSLISEKEFNEIVDAIFDMLLPERLMNLDDYKPSEKDNLEDKEKANDEVFDFHIGILSPLILLIVWTTLSFLLDMTFNGVVQ